MMKIEAFPALLMLGLVAAALRVSASSWSYNATADNGPSHWKEISATCSGQRQSPIDITTAKEESIGEFIFSNYARSDGHFDMVNNGHAVEVEVEEDVRITIRGGGLPGTYRLAQFHFHFGSVNNGGSEHTLNSYAYPMEIHLVHYNEKYKNVSSAISDPSGIAVLGVFVKIGAFNADLDKMIRQVPNIKLEGKKVTVTAFAVQKLLPDDKIAYYRYLGSLTTPGCAESVIWTLFKQPIEISRKQMAQFRKVSVVNNYRPTQPLNSRVVLLNE